MEDTKSKFPIPEYDPWTGEPNPYYKKENMSKPTDIYTRPFPKKHYDPNQLELSLDIDIPTIVPFVSEVEEFNALMNKPNNYEPTIPEKKEWEFVYNFVLEELEEYREACERGDIVEVLDALCDITYVSLGNGAMLHGLKDKIWPAYQEVQASNLSKACSSEDEARATVEKRSEEQGEPCHYEKVGDKYIVYRSRDRKVMKNINYFRPDLKQFFNEKELKSNE